MIVMLVFAWKFIRTINFIFLWHKACFLEDQRSSRIQAGVTSLSFAKTALTRKQQRHFKCLLTDDLDCKLSTSDDYFNEQDEELRHRVQPEAEERKLEEILEHQRRIEEEVKQKHLAEQFS